MPSHLFDVSASPRRKEHSVAALLPDASVSVYVCVCVGVFVHVQLGSKQTFHPSSVAFSTSWRPPACAASITPCLRRWPRGLGLDPPPWLLPGPWRMKPCSRASRAPSPSSTPSWISWRMLGKSCQKLTNRAVWLWFLVVVVGKKKPFVFVYGGQWSGNKVYFHCDSRSLKIRMLPCLLLLVFESWTWKAQNYPFYFHFSN